MEDVQKHPKDILEFALGELVCLASAPTERGAVIQAIPGNPENRFKVFIKNSPETFYASQLQAVDSDSTEVATVGVEQFHSRMTALQINHPALSQLYSLNAARIDFIPYQFRPVMRFIRSDRPRLLIADSVGVGKTIEAGLILRELQARREMRSVLIICPRALVAEKKWQNELKRFDEKFDHLDPSTLRYCLSECDLEGVWPDKHQKVILPYSLLNEANLQGKKGKGQKGLFELDPPPHFDLVIVDEAHHARNPGTYRHRAVSFFCDNADAVVFLTATPIQLGNNDLFVLLNMLRPDLIIDRESFAYMYEPNPFINKAVAAMRAKESQWQERAQDALDNALGTPWGKDILAHNQELRRIRAELAAEKSPQDEQRVEMIRDTEELHSFAGIINRTRRRDIGDFTVRKPETREVKFTTQQKQVHDELLRIQAEIYEQFHGAQNVNFMMTTIKRQAASCLFGLVPRLREILYRSLDAELDTSDLAIEHDSAYPSDETVQRMKHHIEKLIATAQDFERDEDPKLEKLVRAVQEKQHMDNNKIMLFSSFRHTLSYLQEQLSSRGFRIGLIQGGTPDDERLQLRLRFEKSRDAHDCIDILLFSEVGSEGLDYQFCDCIVNYDLPWNPMRIEQRIGRIDRRGQKSEAVAIINLITPNTVDGDIYDRCLSRIGVFEKALGENESILGEISSKIKNIVENFELTEEERRAKLDQLTDNSIRDMREQEELEHKQAELFGIQLTDEQLKRDIDAASSYWLKPDSLRRLVSSYLGDRVSQTIRGEKPLKSIRLAQEARNVLLEDLRLLNRQPDAIFREWERWLKGSSQHLAITFDATYAREHPEAIFITPTHPLVKQAAQSFGDSTKQLAATLVASSNDVPAGTYPFAIFHWRMQGVREDVVFKPVSTLPALTDQLVALLAVAIDDPTAAPPNTADLEELETQHYELWVTAKQQHSVKMHEQVAQRRQSLRKSHEARVANLSDQLSRSEGRIQIMRESQLSGAARDYDVRTKELDVAETTADILATQVAYGTLTIMKGDSTHAD